MSFKNSSWTAVTSRPVRFTSPDGRVAVVRMIERERGKAHLVAALACTVLALPLSCGGSASGPNDPGGSATLGGTVPGRTFVAMEAAATNNGSPPVGTYPFLLVAIADSVGAACGDLGAAPRASSQALRLYFYNEQDQSPIGPGTYLSAGAQPLFVYPVFHAFGEATDSGYCAEALALEPVSSTATLTEVSATRAVGSFDLVFAAPGDAGSGDGGADAGGTHLSGTFTAPWCPSTDAGVTCS